jgi:hypothetical protein
MLLPPLVATQGSQEDDSSPWSARPRLQRLLGEHTEPPPASNRRMLPSPCNRCQNHLGEMRHTSLSLLVQTMVESMHRSS